MVGANTLPNFGNQVYLYLILLCEILSHPNFYQWKTLNNIDNILIIKHSLIY